MATGKTIPAELLEQLRRDRSRIADELPGAAGTRPTTGRGGRREFPSGHLRLAIHRSGRPLKKIAAEVGLNVLLLCDFLEGTATLRSGRLGPLGPSRRRRDPSGADTPATAGHHQGAVSLRLRLLATWANVGTKLRTFQTYRIMNVRGFSLRLALRPAGRQRRHGRTGSAGRSALGS